MESSLVLSPLTNYLKTLKQMQCHHVYKDVKTTQIYTHVLNRLFYTI